MGRGIWTAVWTAPDREGRPTRTRQTGGAGPFLRHAGYLPDRGNAGVPQGVGLGRHLYVLK